MSIEKIKQQDNHEQDSKNDFGAVPVSTSPESSLNLFTRFLRRVSLTKPTVCGSEKLTNGSVKEANGIKFKMLDSLLCSRRPAVDDDDINKGKGGQLSTTSSRLPTSTSIGPITIIPTNEAILSPLVKPRVSKSMPFGRKLSMIPFGRKLSLSDECCRADAGRESFTTPPSWATMRPRNGKEYQILDRLTLQTRPARTESLTRESMPTPASKLPTPASKRQLFYQASNGIPENINDFIRYDNVYRRVDQLDDVTKMANLDVLNLVPPVYNYTTVHQMHNGEHIY